MFNIKLNILSLCVLSCLISQYDTANILALFASPSKSHTIVGQALLKILAKNGHNVTMVSPFTLSNPPKNYREIKILDLRTLIPVEVSKSNTTNLFTLFSGNPITLFLKIYDMSAIFTKATLEDDAFQNLLKSNEKFDIIINQVFLNEALFALAEHFDAYAVGFSPIGATEWVDNVMGNPTPYAYTPQKFLPFTDHMTFFERVINTIVTAASDLALNYISLPQQEALRQKYFPQTKPLDKLLRNISLIFINSHPSISTSRPSVPSLIEIGGFHVSEPEPLPDDLQRIMDNATNGVIYFSMGTNLPTSLLPDDKRNAILTAFSKVKQTVLWKWEESDLPGKPSNVEIRKWFPQSDILAHPNMKLFITHGGFGSTVEAITRGVPLIGIPILGDQRLNMVSAKNMGYAITLDFNNLTADGLTSALNEILKNKTYTKNIKSLSSLLNDRPMKIADEINYWIEYIMRHKGAPHLRTARNDLKLYQYLLLDIIGFVILVLSIVFILLYFILKFIVTKLKQLFSKATKRSNHSKKKLE